MVSAHRRISAGDSRTFCKIASSVSSKVGLPLRHPFNGFSGHFQIFLGRVHAIFLADDVCLPYGISHRLRQHEPVRLAHEHGRRDVSVTALGVTGVL